MTDAAFLTLSQEIAALKASCDRAIAVTSARIAALVNPVGAR